ncbi:hypothetical protein [Micromonospora sp. DT233]|uniref:hypothetical protein n=1 Tax=Micromonospora sp. DT233 TaxID=3393432 RepID=UPI003CF09D46
MDRSASVAAPVLAAPVLGGGERAVAGAGSGATPVPSRHRSRRRPYAGPARRPTGRSRRDPFSCRHRNPATGRRS